MIRVIALIFVVGVGVYLSPQLCAQGSTVDVQGTVMDPTGAIIPGAEVRLVYPSGKVARSTRSEGDGTFTFSAVAPGDYTLRIHIRGFASRSQKIVVAHGQPISANIELQVAGGTEVVNVVAEAVYSESVASTATRTSVPLRDVPQAIEVVNQELIRAQAASSIQDAVRNVAGVSMHMGEGRRDQVFIRGFSALSDFLVDGVRDDATYYRDLETLDRIEVLKGPAAALYGRGSSGGIINRILKRPSPEQPIVAEFSAAFGGYGQKRFGADLGASFFDGRLSFRVPGAWEESGSHRHFYHLDRYTAAPSFLWKPRPGTRVLGQFDYLRDSRVADRGIPSVEGRPAAVDIGTYYGYPQDDFLDNDVFSQALNIDHEAGSWIIRNNFRHTGYDNRFTNTFPQSTSGSGDSIMVNRGQYNVVADQENYFNNTEAMKRALVLGMEHTFLVGVEYGHQTRDTVRFNGTADPVSLIDPVLTPPQYSAIAGTDNEFRGSVAAGYVQDQIAIAPKWKAMVGARYDYFDQFLHDRRPAAEDLGRIDREWSPRAGLVYQPWFPVSFYGSFSRSFQPSGEGLSLATNNQELGPETTRNLEAGMKMELFRRALNTTVSVFNLQRNNIKTVDPLDPTQLVLAGKQRTNGVEISFNGRLGTNLDVYGGYAWLDGKILESNSLSAGVPIEGKRAGSVPLHSGNIWATYRFGSGFGFGGGVIYNDDRYVANDNTVTLPAFTRVDATLFWRKQHYDFAVNVRNLGNIRYYETAHANSQIYPGAPINATVTTRFRW